MKEENGSNIPKIIAITSGKGGVGKTNIAINLGISFANKGKKVIVIDADLGLANVNILLGIVPKYNLYNVIKGQKSFSEIIIDTPYGIRIVAGASGFSQLANLPNDKREDIVKGLEELETADIIIIDTSAGITENVISFITIADEIIVVTTPEPTAITDAYGIIKALISRSINKNIKLVVNMVSSLNEGKKVAERVINISGQFLNVKVEELGSIFNDDIVKKAVINQKPFLVLSPKSKASTCIENICYKLEKIEYPVKRGFKNFLKNIFNYNN